MYDITHYLQNPEKVYNPQYELFCRDGWTMVGYKLERRMPFSAGGGLEKIKLKQGIRGKMEGCVIEFQSDNTIKLFSPENI